MSDTNKYAQTKAYVAVRKRKELNKEFVEVFFKGSNQVLVPSFDVARFKNRYDMPVYTNSFAIMEIKKSSQQVGAYRTRENILSDGVWLVESDWLPKGGVPFANVPFLPTYFGIKVQVTEEFKADWPTVQEQLHVDKHDAPIVVYHGTSRDYMKSILETGLKPSYGMFGNAIYFGSFWKAYRFACLTQDYKDRNGAIIRCLTFWNKTYLRNHDAMPTCLCTNCKGAPTYADHLQEWAKTGADNIMLYPVMLLGHWVIRNEEYASLSAENIILDTIGLAKRTTTGPYQPWDRTVCIL